MLPNPACAKNVRFNFSRLVRHINTIKARNFNERVIDESESFEHARQLGSGLVLFHIRLRSKVTFCLVPVTAPGLRLDRDLTDDWVLDEGH